MLTIPERTALPEATKGEVLKRLLDTYGADLRIAEPGIIQSFDSAKQTVTVSVALKERVVQNGNVTWEEIPTLLDVPIVFPRAGDYVLTFPVAEGDECLVIFGDKCMDAWWQSGGVQNPMELRRHDLSDGYAILGCWSQPRVLPNYSEDTVQLRNEAGTAYFELAAGRVMNIVGATLNIKVGTLNIQGESGNASAVVVAADSIQATQGSELTLKAGGQTTIEDRVFLQHTHKNVKSGTDISGDVT